jgi:hypothetical protein
VAVLVVHALEPVDVEQQRDQVLPAPLGDAPKGLELLLHPPSVGQPGQRVGVREPALLEHGVGEPLSQLHHDRGRDRQRGDQHDHLDHGHPDPGLGSVEHPDTDESGADDLDPDQPPGQENRRQQRRPQEQQQRAVAAGPLVGDGRGERDGGVPGSQGPQHRDHAEPLAAYERRGTEAGARRRDDEVHRPLPSGRHRAGDHHREDAQHPAGALHQGVRAGTSPQGVGRVFPHGG